MQEIKCKWNFDEVCCNGENKEMVADFCHSEQMEKCEFREEK